MRGDCVEMPNGSWVLVAPESFKYVSLELEAIASGYARIRVAYCGICGSDLHSYKGLHPNVKPPIVLGHEFSGTVEGVGLSEDASWIGCHVVASPSVPCGTCYQCETGNDHICDDLKVVGNIAIPGAFAHYLDVPVDRLLPVPPDMPLADAALVEPTAVAVHALKRVASYPEGIVVIGAGPIGMVTALVAKARGVRRIALLDVREDRLARARELGIEWTLNSRSEDVHAALEEWYPNGPDAVFDCVAIPETVNLALREARKGSTIVLEGVPEGPMTVDAILIQDRELRLLGTLMYQIPDFEEAIGLVQRGDISSAKLVSRIVDLESVPSTFAELAQGSSEDLKVLVKI